MIKNLIFSNVRPPMPAIAVFIVLGLCILFGGNQVASKFAPIAFPPLLCGAFAFTLSSITLWMYAQINYLYFLIPR